MRRKRVQTLYLKSKNVSRDKEGVPEITYGRAVELKGEVWPASGKLQVEMYGERISYIRNCKIEGRYNIRTEGEHITYVFGDFTLREGDGICLYAGEYDKPDYKIISIKPYNPLYMELEKL